MQVKYNYLSEQFADFESYLPDLRELVASGEFTLGPYVDRFEKEFAEYIGVKHVVSTNNGTDALILAIKSIGVRPGDEVITVANTFVATAGAIVAAGAVPVFVDCDDRHSIDVSKIEAAVTPRTRAVIPVHWAGCPADLQEVLSVSRRCGISVIEDACPAVGASIGGKKCGSFGKVNAFSMHPLKPLNVWGDGGMVTTDDDEIAEWLRLYRNHGLKDRDHVEIWGVNNRLQPFQAVVASRLLKNMDSLVQSRNVIARRLDRGLSELTPFVKVPHRPPGMIEAYQLYLVTVDRRDELLLHLTSHGIEAKIHYPIPLHLQNAAKPFGYKKGDFPEAERQADRILTLPCHQFLTLEQADYMVQQVKTFYSKS